MTHVILISSILLLQHLWFCRFYPEAINQTQSPRYQSIWKALAEFISLSITLVMQEEYNEAMSGNGIIKDAQQSNKRNSKLLSTIMSIVF